MEKQKESKKNNGKLTLYPLKFKEVVKDLLRAKPINNPPKNKGK